MDEIDELKRNNYSLQEKESSLNSKNRVLSQELDDLNYNIRTKDQQISKLKD